MMQPENVWDYPRPPRLERVPYLLEVIWNEQTLASTRDGWRVLETSHPPTYYFPPADIRFALLASNPRRSWCEWKGQAVYWDVVGGPAAVAWSYPQPTADFAPLADALAFYPSPFVCRVDGQLVQAQPGDFYGGWITPNLQGPFKGPPGTLGW